MKAHKKILIYLDLQPLTLILCYLAINIALVTQFVEDQLKKLVYNHFPHMINEVAVFFLRLRLGSH